jgi:hypothetical protein
MDLTFIKGQTNRAQSTLGKGSPSERRLRLMAAPSNPAREWRWIPADSSVSAKVKGWLSASDKGV